jgi:hypothetical protein
LTPAKAIGIIVVAALRVVPKNSSAVNKESSRMHGLARYRATRGNFGEENDYGQLLSVYLRLRMKYKTVRKI